jgi:putative acetyltransferase
MLIRDYQPEDARALTDIFYDSIHQVAVEHYTPEQAHAWAPLPKDYDGWQQRLDGKPPFVAEIDGEIVGFITLESDGHIDWTYTHPGFQRRGIAGKLYQHLESVARDQGMARLYVEASYLARPFFEQRGFEVMQQNNTQRHGQTLSNWSMQKRLDAADH